MKKKQKMMFVKFSHGTDYDGGEQISEYPVNTKTKDILHDFSAWLESNTNASVFICDKNGQFIDDLP